MMQYALCINKANIHIISKLNKKKFQPAPQNRPSPPIQTRRATPLRITPYSLLIIQNTHYSLPFIHYSLLIIHKIDMPQNRP